MKYAVDRYILGRELEVTAESFLSLPYIPGRKNRFFCPECGETVFFRAKGRGEFYHQKQIEGITPECDKRVDGRSGLSLYERTGLSTYIIHDAEKRYCLGISFPPLGRQTLDAATRQEVVVRIAACGKDCKFRVSHVLFFADQSTLLPVDFLPPAGEKYTIEIQNAGSIAGIRQKWANYADGFEAAGALFQYGEESGKKIHRGDGISTGKQYYLVTERPYTPPYPEIHSEWIGFIRMKGGELTVSRLIVNVSSKNATRYSLINSYLRSRFGVWLLEISPELTTLWPPTVLQQDAQVPVTATVRKIHCSVSSGNDTPNVYSYFGNSVSQLNVVENRVILPFYGSETAASVDRKYVGREVFYRRTLLPPQGFSYKVSLDDSGGYPLDWETFTQASLAAVRSIKANAKMELWIGCKGNIYQHVTVRENITQMPALEYPEEVYLAVEENKNCSTFFYRHVKKAERITLLDEDYFIVTLKKYRNGPLVPVPTWVAWIVRDCGKKGNIKLARFICREVSSGKIPLGLLKALFSMKEVTIREASQ